MTYDRNFFSDLKDSAKASAQVVVPLIREWIAPSSVVDLGCGTGTWLSVFRDSGVTDVLGVDGDYVDRSMLEIPAPCFRAHNLETKYATDRKFDLAMSLEVAEHLPVESGPKLVESLVELASVVLFSAAIPHQPGTHHVNCQWPAFWASLFARHGFVTLDCLRLLLWDNASVAWWYQQNLLIFARQDALEGHPKLSAVTRPQRSDPASLVHPELLQGWVNLVPKDAGSHFGATLQTDE